MTLHALLFVASTNFFGKYYQTADGKKINGIDILNITTDAGDKRHIGNIVIKNGQFGELVGYENHSGLTSLGDNVEPFGEVILGAGNNGKDKTEGCRYKNCIGTYFVRKPSENKRTC